MPAKRSRIFKQTTPHKPRPQIGSRHRCRVRRRPDEEICRVALLPCEYFRDTALPLLRKFCWSYLLSESAAAVEGPCTRRGVSRQPCRCQNVRVTGGEARTRNLWVSDFRHRSRLYRLELRQPPALSRSRFPILHGPPHCLSALAAVCNLLIVLKHQRDKLNFQNVRAACSCFTPSKQAARVPNRRSQGRVMSPVNSSAGMLIGGHGICITPL